MLETPVRVGQCDGSAGRLFADVIEQAATQHFANLSFIVYQQILGDSLDDFGDAFLPFRVPLRHLDLAAGQTDYGGTPGGASHRDRQVLYERMKTVSSIAITIEVIQHLVEKNQYRTARLLDRDV